MYGTMYHHRPKRKIRWNLPPQEKYKHVLFGGVQIGDKMRYNTTEKHAICIKISETSFKEITTGKCYYLGYPRLAAYHYVLHYSAQN